MNLFYIILVIGTKLKLLVELKLIVFSKQDCRLFCGQYLALLGYPIHIVVPVPLGRMHVVK